MAAAPQKTIREAAVLLRCLPATQRTQLLGKLEPRQAAAVADEMNKLERIGGDEQAAVLHEFAAARATCFDRRHLTKTVPFQFLHDHKTDALLDLLADEHPQAVALVLSHLPSQQAGAALAKLSPARQISVLCRIATMNQPSPEVVRDVEEVLKLRVSRPVSQSPGKCGVASVVRILNRMEPAAERRLLGVLAETDPPLSREIRRAMFGPDVAECEDWGTMEAAG